MPKELTPAQSDLKRFTDQLSEQSPAFAEAMSLEAWTDELSRRVREELRQKRDRSELSQTEVAKRMGVDQSAISKLENGNGDIGLKTLMRFAIALNYVPLIVFAPCPQEVRESLKGDPRPGGTQWRPFMPSFERIQNALMGIIVGALPSLIAALEPKDKLRS